jgi:outer membrane protein
MRLIFPPALIALLLSTPTAADTLEVTLGAAVWAFDVSGTVRYKARDSANDIDVNDDLGYDDDDIGFFYAVLEHPLPVLPNLKLGRANLDADASGRLSQSFVFGDLIFNVNENVDTDVKLDQTDITLYYRPLDSVVNLDLGLNAKYIDAETRIRGEISGTETANVSGWVPMLYTGMGVNLPLSGLSVSADGSFAKYQGSDFYDVTLRANYSTPWFFGIDAGYRKIRLDLDDFDNSYADVEFDGPYLGAYLHF